MGGGVSKDTSAYTVTVRKFTNLPKVPKDLQWTSAKIENKFITLSDNELNFNYWSFNLWKYQKSDLIQLSMLILSKFDIPTKFSISAEHWFRLMHKVERLMNSFVNPYHNFLHIMDVMQSSAVIISEFECKKYLKDDDVFVTLISAIVHDLEHPGTNNLYQINAATPLAIRYNDTSVLENHHCATAFELFSQPDSMIMQNLPIDQKKLLRKKIIALILSTDMSYHFTLKNDLDQVITSYLSPQNVAEDGTRQAMDEKSTLILMRSVLHAADISNPAKIWTVSKKWSDMVVEEFFSQGDKEIKEGYPVSMNCDRSKTHQDELSINFTDFIVAPFFFSLTKLLPKLFTACSIMEANRNKWHEMLCGRIATSIEDCKLEETMDKWENRKKAFAEKIRETETVQPTAPNF